ncbi:hypothetical protein BDQ12DRAFT_692259 [Crucibulum laeve]|uniref:Uncharacterized protein n=1 Tax=Crucibulum laeve TaxID=68775 RepID=A0A5C3LV82_9AGAR|nr:hypothetical protein BDQ12DRAFT_692259 [Crucibulum laeve]
METHHAHNIIVILNRHHSRRSSNSWGWDEEGSAYSVQSGCPDTMNPSITDGQASHRLGELESETGKKRSKARRKPNKVNSAVPDNLQKHENLTKCQHTESGSFQQPIGRRKGKGGDRRDIINHKVEDGAIKSQNSTDQRSECTGDPLKGKPFRRFRYFYRSNK